MQSRQSDFSAYVCLLLAAIFWGGNYVVGSVLVLDLPPIFMVELRWGFAAIILLAISARNLWFYRYRISKQLLSLIMFSLLGPVLFPWTLYIGLQYTSALNAAIILSFSPTLVLIINALVFRESINRAKVMGVVLSSVGVFYLLLHGRVMEMGDVVIGKGEIWAFLSVLSWAIYCSGLRLKDKKLPGLVFVSITAALGAIMIVPFTFYSLVSSEFSLPNFHWSLLLGIAYLVFCPSILSYLLWNQGIAQIGASRGEVFTHFVPFSGAILSIVFLGVAVKSYHLIGALLIVFGIYFCARKVKI